MCQKLPSLYFVSSLAVSRRLALSLKIRLARIFIISSRWSFFWGLDNPNVGSRPHVVGSCRGPLYGFRNVSPNSTSFIGVHEWLFL